MNFNQMCHDYPLGAQVDIMGVWATIIRHGPGRRGCLHAGVRSAPPSIVVAYVDTQGGLREHTYTLSEWRALNPPIPCKQEVSA